MNVILVSIVSAGVIAVMIVVIRMYAQLNQQLVLITQQINERLRENSQALSDTHRTVGDRLDAAQRVFGDVQRSLGRLEETHKEIVSISRDISSLQNLLRAPKFRGEMGETLLGRLLEDILPKEHVHLQYRFKTGDIADGVISVSSHLIAIDAKFPLENFRKYSDQVSEEEKTSAYRMFVRDVKKRVDEVASKYILPDEQTLDFALMYIPAEAVYYAILRDEELTAYANARKVIFVSPNTLYAYLQAILYGLRGVSIERNIQAVYGEIAGAQVELGKFQDDFDTIGSHLTNASTKFRDAGGKLSKVRDKLRDSLQQPQR